MTSATNSITTNNLSRDAHNTLLGYVVPQNGVLKGFTVDFIEKSNGATFYVFNWSPTDISLNYLTSITSNNSNYEDYGSATTFLDEDIVISKGSYIFAAQLIENVANPASGPCHITAYVVFTN